MDNNQDKRKLIEDIINGMLDWVRVVDKDNRVIFINKAMAEGLKDFKMDQLCYKLLGRDTPCENCISREAIFRGSSHMKQEIINGKIFSVMSSPVKNESGEIVAAVEVLRDITELQLLQEKVMEQNKKLMDDLSIAKKLQCSLLPKALPEDKVRFSFFYHPCEDLGGDFLDIFEIDKDHVGIYIADVSGHGVPASMLTVFLRSAIDRKNLSPSSALTKLYKDFNSSNFDHEVYITVFYAIIDLRNYKIKYSNAGHNISPVLFNPSDAERFELLRIPGIPISNWLEKPVYTDNEISLEKFDRVFFCTDGIIELKNKKGEQFGEDRLRNVIFNDKSDPNSTLAKIIDEATKFAEIDDFQMISDDITMALIEIKE
ncbi:MAG TPA: SpoIIE family protein phosphatase [Pseudobacteroides sp.]|uniref:SpoIIE family protein phosphatase n=1 Tax=Pseudobacteroides sp. TaxID=1968840 RepID=UPI002F9569F7